MLRGLPASIIAHAAVFSATYFTFPLWGSAGRTYATSIEAVDVQFAELGEITDLRAIVPNEVEEAEAVPEQPEEVPEEDPLDEELPEAEEDVSNVNEEAPQEEDPEDLLPDFTPDEPEEPEEQPKPEPEPEPKPPRDPLADFLNQSETTFKSEIETQREREDQPPPPAQDKPKTELTDPPKAAETRKRQGAGDRQANTARVEAILYSKIFPCWDGVNDLPYPEQLNVSMSVKLNRNGTIADLRLVEPARRPLGNSPMGTAVDRALRAVRKCAPYNLPDDDYEYWSEGRVNLGPAFTPTNQR